MLNIDIATIGGFCAILMGVLLFVTGIIFLFLDPCRNSKGARDLFRFLSDNPKPRFTIFWLTAFNGLFAIGAVTAISKSVHGFNEGWMNWVTVIAYIGFGTMAIENFRSLQIYPPLLADYKAADDTVKLGLMRSASMIPLDPRGWLTYSGVGVFLFVANFLAFQNDAWSPALAIIGMLVGFFNQFMVFANVSKIYATIKVGAALSALVLGPIWYVWMGIHLLS